MCVISCNVKCGVPKVIVKLILKIHVCACSYQHLKTETHLMDWTLPS